MASKPCGKPFSQYKPALYSHSSPNICTGTLPEHIEPRSTWMIKVKRDRAETLRLIAMAATHFLMKTCQLICI